MQPRQEAGFFNEFFRKLIGGNFVEANRDL